MSILRTKSVEQSLKDTEDPEFKLKRSLTALDLTVFGVGVIIGAGIFTLTGRVAQANAGPCEGFVRVERDSERLAAERLVNGEKGDTPASLARLEGQIAIGAIVSELPKLRLATAEPEWRETLTLRGLKSLPVEF